MNSTRSILALLCAATLSACGDSSVQSIIAPATGANVKFYNFALNAPGVNFYSDNTKITAISSSSGAESTNGTVYGGVGNAGLYNVIAPGAHVLTGKIAATTDNGLAISNVSTTLADGKYYSYYTTGPYDPVAKTASAFIVEDPFVSKIDYTQAYVRFVNTIYNAAPLVLYAKNTTTGVEAAVGAAVAYQTAGAFTPLPGAFYDLSARYAGSSTNVITRTGVSFSSGYVYTISARGDITVVSTTATNRPILDNTANR